MDPAGSAASLITLLSAVIAITKTIADLIRRIQGAPEELQEISLKITIVRAQLEQLISIKACLGQSDDQTLSSVFRKTVESSLGATQRASLDIHDALQPLKDKAGLRTRVLWALLEQGKVENLLRKLRDVQQSLGVSLQILEMYLNIQSIGRHLLYIDLLRQINIVSKNSLLAIRADLDRVFTKMNDIENNMRGLQSRLGVDGQPYHRCCGHVSSKSLTDAAHKNSFVYSTDRFLRISIWSGRVERRDRVAQRPVSSFTLEIPLSMSGDRVFKLKVTMENVPLSYWWFRLERFSPSIRIVVPDTAKIMDACERGHILTVRELLQKGQAKPNDMSSSGATPLMVRSISFHCINYPCSIIYELLSKTKP